MKKHILVISQYFYPEQFRINDICKEWVKKGYKVTVVTGIPNYPEGKFYSGFSLFNNNNKVYEGINIIRLPIIPRGKNTLMLMLNYLSFVISGYVWKSFTKIKADSVFIFEVSPMTQALPGIWYAKKMNIPCLIYVQDLWPENVEIITGIKNKRLIDMITKMVMYIYSNCDYVFASSKSFVRSITDRGVPIEKVKYWPQFAEDFYKPVINLNAIDSIDNTNFNIVFTGNIGEAQGLEVLPKTANLFKNNNINNIKFNIVGDGRYKEKLQEEIIKLKVESYFNFIVKQPAENIPNILAACDLAFLSFKDNPLFRWTIPAKLQSYLACAMPVVASAAGETENIINESKAGYCSHPGNEMELFQNILKLFNTNPEELRILGENGRRYSQKNFNKTQLMDQIDNYI